MHPCVHAALQACLAKVSLLKDVRPSTTEVAGGRGLNEVLHKNMLVAFHYILFTASLHHFQYNVLP